MQIVIVILILGEYFAAKYDPVQINLIALIKNAWKIY